MPSLQELMAVAVRKAERQKELERPDFAEREAERKRQNAIDRNRSRLDEHAEQARVAQLLTIRLKEVLQDTPEVTVATVDNIVEIYGVDPSCLKEMILIGSANIVATHVTFLETTIAFTPLKDELVVTRNGSKFTHLEWRFCGLSHREGAPVSQAIQIVDHTKRDVYDFTKSFASDFLKTAFFGPQAR